jgi:3-oxoadipate enol-lactonase
MPFTTGTEIPLYYEVFGEGPPLCLIAGYRQNSAAWPREFITRLAARTRTIIFDNRGTGRSDKPADGYEFAHQARDVIGLLDHLGIPRTNLLGFSMGGAIAQEVVVGHPRRIDRLVLFGTFCGGVWAEPASWSVLRRLFDTDGLSPEQAARQALPVTYSPDYLASNPLAVQQQMRRELAFPTPAFVCRKQMAALRNFDRYYDLPRVRAATLVATGVDDVLVRPRNSAIIAGRIPNARLEMIADLGHRAIWEAPEEMAELIGDFVAHSSARAAAALAGQLA